MAMLCKPVFGGREKRQIRALILRAESRDLIHAFLAASGGSSVVRSIIATGSFSLRDLRELLLPKVSPRPSRALEAREARICGMERRDLFQVMP
jgi:hypothetical protein